MTDLTLWIETLPVYDCEDARAEGNPPIGTADGADEATRLLRRHYEDSGDAFVRAVLSPDRDFFFPAGLAELAQAPVAAHAWQCGLIEFRAHDEPMPDGALGLPAAPRPIYENLARHGYEGQLIVPGVPEAESPSARVDALIAFVGRVESALEGR